MGRSRATSLAHLRLDPLQIFGSERLLLVEIVIEPLVRDGPHPDLRIGEELLDRLREEVRGAVTVDFQVPRAAPESGGPGGCPPEAAT